MTGWVVVVAWPVLITVLLLVVAWIEREADAAERAS